MANIENTQSTSEQARVVSSPSADLATVLSTMPTNGTEDDVSRLIEVYESVERVYRDASLAGNPVIGSSSSANL